MNELPLGQTAVVRAIGGDAELRARIQSMGLRAGRQIAVMRRSRYGGPLQVRIGTTDLLIRPQQALLVEIEFTS
ncbi:MAG: ferrous iron transport protein A [Gammaproteobacteria bacterium]|nr:ferrous iron transport protein A [Gammaproteobacteria bacterium]